jgi:hypothetical protein
MRRGLPLLVFKYHFFSWGETETTLYSIWSIVPAPDGDCGVIGGMRIGRKTSNPTWSDPYIQVRHNVFITIDPTPVQPELLGMRGTMTEHLYFHCVAVK